MTTAKLTQAEIAGLYEVRNLMKANATSNFYVIVGRRTDLGLIVNAHATFENKATGMFSFAVQQDKAYVIDHGTDKVSNDHPRTAIRQMAERYTGYDVARAQCWDERCFGHTDCADDALPKGWKVYATDGFPTVYFCPKHSLMYKCRQTKADWFVVRAGSVHVFTLKNKHGQELLRTHKRQVAYAGMEVSDGVQVERTTFYDDEVVKLSYEGRHVPKRLSNVPVQINFIKSTTCSVTVLGTGEQRDSVHVTALRKLES